MNIYERYIMGFGLVIFFRDFTKRFCNVDKNPKTNLKCALVGFLVVVIEVHTINCHILRRSEFQTFNLRQEWHCRVFMFEY